MEPISSRNAMERDKGDSRKKDGKKAKTFAIKTSKKKDKLVKVYP